MVMNGKGLSPKPEKTPSQGENALRYFASLSPMQQERVITQIHTIGSKQEMRRFAASMRDADSGRIETL